MSIENKIDQHSKPEILQSVPDTACSPESSSDSEGVSQNKSVENTGAKIDAVREHLEEVSQPAQVDKIRAWVLSQFSDLNRHLRLIDYEAKDISGDMNSLRRRESIMTELIPSVIDENLGKELLVVIEDIGLIIKEAEANSKLKRSLLGFGSATNRDGYRDLMSGARDHLEALLRKYEESL
jgi:hypothetical protein